MINYRLLEDESRKTGLVLPARDGLFTLKTSAGIFHSQYSPGKEAQRLVEGILSLDRSRTLVVIFGAGLGYHVELLERAGFDNMIVIERDKDAARFFQKIYALPDNVPFIGPDDGVERLDTALSLFEIQKVRNIKTLFLRGAYNEAAYKPFEDRLDRLLKVKLGDFSTRLRFEELWFLNILRNIPSLAYSAPVSALFSSGRRIPITVVSAGPTLRRSLEGIRTLSEKSLIIAVDTALLPLDEAGIVPDLVYSLDSQVHNLTDFTMVSRKTLSGTSLVSDIVVNPALPEYARSTGVKRLFTANTAHLDLDFDGNPYFVKSGLVNWLESAGDFRIGDIETGGSVATSAFHLAYLMGGDPIILCGQDLAYTWRTSHSPSTPHLVKTMKRLNRLQALESIFLQVMQSRKAFAVEATGGGKAWTDFVLNNFRGWFEESGKNIHKVDPGMRLWNVTPGGALIPPFEAMDISEAAVRLQSGPYRNELTAAAGVKNLLDGHKFDKIITALQKLRVFLRAVEHEKEALFRRTAASEWSFLGKYFMREELLFDKYRNLDKTALERKFYRLYRAIDLVLGRK